MDVWGMDTRNFQTARRKITGGGLHTDADQSTGICLSPDRPSPFRCGEGAAWGLCACSGNRDDIGIVSALFHPVSSVFLAYFLLILYCGEIRSPRR